MANLDIACESYSSSSLALSGRNFWLFASLNRETGISSKRNATRRFVTII
jgi:penicillin V acylase-like amidase (Ntn superfamily)